MVRWYFCACYNVFFPLTVPGQSSDNYGRRMLSGDRVESDSGKKYIYSFCEVRGRLAWRTGWFCGSYSILWQSSDISSDRPVSRFQKRFPRFIFTPRWLINLFRVLWAREGAWGCDWDPLTILWHSSDKKGLCYGSNSFRATGNRNRAHARIENWVKLYPKLAQKNNQENSCRDKNFRRPPFQWSFVRGKAKLSEEQ